LRAVLDANVYIAAFITPGGTPGRILELAQAGQFALVLSQVIVTQLEDVLARSRVRRYLRRSPEWIAELLAELRVQGLWAEPEPVQAVVRDPDDDPILGTALAAQADYLVSGDEDLTSLRSFQGVQIVTPRRFLDILEQQA
jgi:putative PIN family toxin of toxin-antitoxin system